MIMWKTRFNSSNLEW